MKSQNFHHENEQIFTCWVEITLGQVFELMTKIQDRLMNGELGFKEEDGGGDPPRRSPTYLLK